MKQGLQIAAVEPGSIADRALLEPGDRILSINGFLVKDVIDYWFLSGDYELVLEIKKARGNMRELELVREEGAPLGVSLEPPRPRRCANACLFCFVDQMPEGLRPTLYVKDEDYRFSFLYGNFVTLSSVSRKDLGRIKKLRLSPLYVSVHATDDDVRRTLLGNDRSLPIMDVLQELTDAGIRIHAQVVLCPGLNDSHHLGRTVSDLTNLFPGVASLAIVPVGLTRHRLSLPDLQPVTSEYAVDFIDEWQPRAERLMKKLGRPFLFLADEFYIIAQRPFPALDFYGDLPQIENGVGMVALFIEEAAQVIEQAERLGSRNVTIVTGESPHRYVAKFLNDLSERTGISFHVVPIANTLFGDSVTVTGLVPGRAVLDQLTGVALGSVIMIPDVMLKEGGDVFIDDMTLNDLQRGLEREVVLFEANPHGFYEALHRLSAG